MTNASLRTPFNIYVIALMCSNIAFVCVNCTLNAVEDAYGPLWVGNFLCTLRMYSLHVFVSMIYHYHLLITLNRAWALFGPVTYRARHNRAIAGTLCGAVVIYVHIVMLPQLILDHLYYRRPLEKGCRLNTDRQFILTEFTSIWMFDVPCVAIPLAYPLLLWKMLSRRRGSKQVNVNNTPAQCEPEEKQEALHRPFKLLTLYTCGTMVCWLPSMCYYIIISKYPSVQWPPGVHQATNNLQNMQSILDPLFFFLLVGDVRHYALRLCKGITMRTSKK
ncbi:uncharacterized protein LOC129600302 [Paramacrobiotus metropolitanus]|uniref:uncharacterized protein LOC129600302 n=1 Tax=Paramacrobiotus metropolitanus TaxID=2943436 RepID=UPI002445FA62|nr:uncharacterized protein LOC129600302 [Paramacrobiotus metropolitanus]